MSSCHKSAKRTSKTVIPSTRCILWCIYDAIEMLQLEAFWNLIGFANCNTAEVNSLNSDKLTGCFFCLFNEQPGYETNLNHVYTAHTMYIHVLWALHTSLASSKHTLSCHRPLKLTAVSKAMTHTYLFGECFLLIQQLSPRMSSITALSLLEYCCSCLKIFHQLNS